MSEFEEIITRLGTRYKDLVLDPSGKSADKFITTQADLKLYDGKAPGDWELIDTKTKGVTLVKDVEDSPKKLIVLEFLDFYNSVKKEIHEKDQIENLKAGGFKGLGSDENELKTSGEEERKIIEMERMEKEAEAELARVIKQKESEKEEENARKREENEKRLEVAMQAKQQEEEELEHLKKVKNSSTWNEGGFNKMKPETRHARDEVYEYEEDDIEECSPTPEQERIFNSVPVRSGSIVQRRPSRTIKGLTPILAECGKIKIGKKGKMIKSQKGTDFRPPERMDHFEITTMDKNDNDDFVLDGYIMAKIGANARELNVRLPYDDPSLNFYTSYSKYDGSACKCRGDGELAINNHKIIQCNPEQCEYYIKNKCKPNGILSLILDDAPRVGGVYKFRTVGWNSINNVYSSMEFIRGLTNGLLAGLPLVLTLTPKHVTIPETSKRTVIYMVNLEYRGSLQDMVTAIQQTISTRSMMQYSVKDFEKLAEEMILLPEAPEECKDIIAEFYPDEVQA